MDRSSRAEIEHALGILLPEYRVKCTLNADGTASLMAEGRHGEAFAVMGLIRSHYHGKLGMQRLVRQIFEEIELARGGPKPDGVLPPASSMRIAR